MSGNTREQLRAVFLAFVMVVSVFGATIAFSGSAAAQTASGGQIQVSDLNDPDDSAQLLAATSSVAIGSGTAGGPTVNAQTIDSSLTTNAPTGVPTTTISSLTAQDGTSGGDSTFANGQEASFTIDINGDGTTDETVNVRMTDSDTAVVSTDGDFTGSNLDDNQVSVDGSNDEEITGVDGTTASKAITIGTQTFDVVIDDSGSGGNDEVQITSTTFRTGSFDVDGDGDQQVDDTVNFVLVDDDSDGAFENLELSITDNDFSEGSLSDNTLLDGNDEEITDSSGSGSATQVQLGNAEFNIRYDSGSDANNVGDGSVDVTATAFKEETTGQATGDGSLDIAVFDTDSNGVYDTAAIADNDEAFNAGSVDDGTVDLTGNSNSEIFDISSNNILTFSGSNDDTSYNIRASEGLQDPVNNRISLELGFQFAQEGNDVGAFVDTNNNVRLDLNQDNDFQDDNEGQFARGEYIDASSDPTSLGSESIDRFNEIYFIEQATSNSLTLEPIPRAGFTYEFSILDTSRTGDVLVNDVGIDVISPDDGNYGSPITVTLGSDNRATITGLNFNFATTTPGSATDTPNNLNSPPSEYLGVASSGTTSASGTDIADVEVRSSDFGTVNVDASVDGLTYDTAEDVTITVTDSGTAVEGAQVSVIQDDGSSTTTLATGFTDSNGEVTLSDVTPTAAGTVRFQATADRGGTQTNSNQADGITDLQTSSSATIEPEELQITSSDNFLKDFQTTPTFTVKFANGTTFSLDSSTDAAGDGAQISISGSVIDTTDTNANTDTYQENSFVRYVTDEGSVTNGNEITDQLTASDEVGIAQAPTAGSFTPDETGDLEVRAEYQEDTGGNGPAEYNVTRTFNVTEANDLNINVQGTLAADGSSDNLDVTVQGSDANGPDAGGSNNLDTAEVVVSGPGVDQSTGENAELSGGGANLGDASRQSSTEYRFSTNANNNGTVEVTVNAVDDNGNEFTETANVSVAGNNITDLSPTGTLTSNDTTNVSLSLSNGAGTVLNNRQVVISQNGIGSSSAAIFRGDVNSDGSDESINKILIDGPQGTIAFDTDDDATSQFDATTGVYEVQNTIAVRGGSYETPELSVESAGVSVDVEAFDANNNLQAFRTDFVTTQGNDVFDVSADVDTFVAGFSEQVNITVTNTTSGLQVNGSSLQRLADTDGDATTTNLLVTQSGQSNNVISSVQTVDTNGDNTDDTVRGTVTADQDTSDAVNITVRNNAQTKIGSTSSAVEAPVVSTNVTNDQLTQRIASGVDVRVIDPRDGQRLTDSQAPQVSNNNPRLRVDSVNGTVEIDDGSTTTELQAGGGTTQPTEFDRGQMNEANNSVAMLAYPDGNSGPQRIQFDVNLDAGTFLGSSNVTVSSPQVDATPDSVTLGSSETLEIVAEDANGQAFDSRTIQIDGAIGQRTGSTDNSGFVAFQISADATGTINVRLDSDDDVVSAGRSPATLSQSDSIEDTVNVTTEQSEFDVSVDPQTVTANTTTTVTVTATNNASGDAVEGASVDLSGAGVNESTQTDANGEAAIDVNASETGTIEVTVNDAGFNSATATITVEEAQQQEPSVSVTFNDQSVQNGTEEVTVDSANFTRADGSAGDYVVVVHVVNDTEFDGGLDSSISAPVGASGNLSNGAESITVDLNSSAAFEDGDALDTLSENVTLRAMLHTTANDSAFGTRLGNAIDGIEPGDETDDANITVTPASPLDGPAAEFDADADGDISITELGDAGTAFAQGELTIAELGAVGQEFAS